MPRNTNSVTTIPMSGRLKYGSLFMESPMWFTTSTAALNTTGSIAHITGLYGVKPPFLQNSRWKGFIGIVLFVLLMVLVNWIDNRFIHNNMFVAAASDDVINIIRFMVPQLLYNAVIVVASVFGCSFLLDKAVSL